VLAKLAALRKKNPGGITIRGHWPLNPTRDGNILAHVRKIALSELYKSAKTVPVSPAAGRNSYGRCIGQREQAYADGR
jgi:hypothetical protein